MQKLKCKINVARENFSEKFSRASKILNFAFWTFNFFFMSNVYYAMIAGAIALAFSCLLALQIRKAKSGDQKMLDIAKAIRDGAMAYLFRQYKLVGLFAVIITAILWFTINWQTGVGFFAGAVLSALAGFIGMSISVRANVKTAEAAKSGLKSALNMAFRGGAVTGMAVVGLALLGVSFFFKI